MEAEDSSEGLVKVAKRTNAYKYAKLHVHVAGKGETCYPPEYAGLNFLFSMKDS